MLRQNLTKRNNFQELAPDSIFFYKDTLFCLQIAEIEEGMGRQVHGQRDRLTLYPIETPFHAFTN